MSKRPDLYTSLTRFKQAMNGGTLPPMTPIPERVRHIIDPAFTPGLGAFEEHPEKGLRCPVVGCGLYFQDLGVHIAAAHSAIGGVTRIKRAISVPQSVSLLSAPLKETRRLKFAANEKSQAAFRAHRGGRRGAAVAGRKQERAAGGKSRNSHATTYMTLNFANDCDAQLAHRLIDLRNSLGRIPSAREFGAANGSEVLSRAMTVWGTWANVVGSVLGDRVRRQSGMSTPFEMVIESLRAWVAVHRELPSMGRADNPLLTPRIPGSRSILAAFNTDSWPEAMRQAAAILDIHGGRYGLPAKCPKSAHRHPKKHLTTHKRLP